MKAIAARMPVPEAACQGHRRRLRRRPRVQRQSRSAGRDARGPHPRSRAGRAAVSARRGGARRTSAQRRSGFSARPRRRPSHAAERGRSFGRCVGCEEHQLVAEPMLAGSHERRCCGSRARSAPGDRAGAGGAGERLRSRDEFDAGVDELRALGFEPTWRRVASSSAARSWPDRAAVRADAIDSRLADPGVAGHRRRPRRLRQRPRAAAARSVQIRARPESVHRLQRPHVAPDVR